MLKMKKIFPHFYKLEAGLIYIKSALLSDSLDFKKAKKGEIGITSIDKENSTNETA